MPEAREGRERAGAFAVNRSGRCGVPLSDLTTIGLGGPARRLVEARSEEAVVQAVAAADATAEPLLVLGGGSNLVIADAGFDGTVVHIQTRGIESHESDGRVRLRVAAGEPWDDLVERCVSDGLAGVECLSGIPGLTGATPIQNVGAYGQEVADTVVAVRAYDRRDGTVAHLARADCEFAYRSSVFRRASRYVVLDVTFELEPAERARPLRYRELARTLGVEPGERPPLAAVREAVLALRRGKGMVLDPADPDTRSVGSFFVNPVLSAEEFAALERRAAQHLGASVRPPAWLDESGRTKTSAAWLIERSGFARGYGSAGVGISGKHTLALVNRGRATTAELLSLAREVRRGVLETFGIALAPEPTLIGVEL